MDFRLRRPCPGCPFTPEGYKVGAERISEICNALERHTFECHDTVYRPQPRDAHGRFLPKPRSHCAGALIVMAKDGHFGDLQQIAMRLGLFDPSRLDLGAPTFNSLEECVAASGGTLRWIANRRPR